MDPNAPVVDGNTAENADDPKTFSEANGDTFSLQNLMAWEENILSIPIDDLDELLCGFSPSSPSDPDVSESLYLNSPSDSAVALAPYDTVPSVLATDPPGPALLPTQGVIPTSTTIFCGGGCFISNCRCCVETDLTRG